MGMDAAARQLFVFVLRFASAVRGGRGKVILAQLRRAAIRWIFDDMCPDLENKLKRFVADAGKLAVARGTTDPFKMFAFIGEALLDSRDPDIQAALRWIDRQHRKDLN
jgi:hypothetical protein